jgi:hypothetical protein
MDNERQRRFVSSLVVHLDRNAGLVARLRAAAAMLRPSFKVPGTESAGDSQEAGLEVREYHITRPLAPPYSLHTVLLKVELYNDTPIEQELPSSKNYRGAILGLHGGPGEGKVHRVGPEFAS